MLLPCCINHIWQFWSADIKQMLWNGTSMGHGIGHAGGKCRPIGTFWHFHFRKYTEVTKSCLEDIYPNANQWKIYYNKIIWVSHTVFMPICMLVNISSSTVFQSFRILTSREF